VTAKIQISKRTPDGSILVLGADNWEDFSQTLDEALSEDSADHVRGMFLDFAETGQTAAVVETRPVRIGERRATSKPQSWGPCPSNNTNEGY
jgi:hypothetical protein